MQNTQAMERVHIQQMIDLCNNQLTSLIEGFASNKEIEIKRRELLRLYTRRRLLEEQEE